jgi:hypothetical protein
MAAQFRVKALFFLLRVTVVVFAARAAAGEPQRFCKFPPADSIVIDKLTAAIAVEFKDFEYARLICEL